VKAPFKPGDYVIYRKQKFSVHPGPRARDVRPAPNGDLYSYEVDKFWMVLAVEGGDKIILCTRRGKHLTLSGDDPALRRAHWVERILFRQRFPAVSQVGTSRPQPST
jgi:hypothetical protein